MATVEGVRQRSAARERRRRAAIEQALALVKQAAEVIQSGSGEICVVIESGVAVRVDTRTGVAVRVTEPLPG